MSPSTLDPEKANPSFAWSEGASSTSKSGLSAVVRGSASREGGGGEGKETAARSHDPVAAYTRSSPPENNHAVSRHGAPAVGAENIRSPVQRCGVDLAGNPPAAASTPSEGVLHDTSEGLDGNVLEDFRGSRPSSEPRSMNGASFEGQPLGNGSLHSVLSILLYRRGNLEVSRGNSLRPSP